MSAAIGSSAACGVAIYRDDRLGDAYRGAAFTCEPTGNLVHSEAVEPDGAGFVGRRVKEGVEFLATRDPAELGPLGGAKPVVGRFLAAARATSDFYLEHTPSCGVPEAGVSWNRLSPIESSPALLMKRVRVS